MSPKGLYAKGMVPSPWYYWEVVEPLEVVHSRRKLGHWESALEGAIGSRALLDSLFAFSYRG
jgi:hypothetical protein